MRTARITIYVSGLVLGLLAATYAHEAFIAADGKLQDFFIGVYSPLVGFLVAILALVIDPAILPGNWAVVRRQKIEVNRRLFRHLIVFYGYLLTLAFILALRVAKYAPHLFEQVAERGVAFMAISSFVWSFELPLTLHSMQQDRFDTEEATRGSPARND